MATINLKDYYPFYEFDTFVEISDTLAQQLKQWERDERAYQRKTQRYRAYFSLDIDNGVENDIALLSQSLGKSIEHKVSREQLIAAISALSDKQARRIYARFFLGISNADIARAEGVRPDTIKESIFGGLRRIKKILKN